MIFESTDITELEDQKKAFDQAQAFYDSLYDTI